MQEIKNRFLCEVRINGESVVCYIPSSCRLSNFINLVGREVLLKPVQDPKARTPFAIFAVKYKRSYILLNTSLANRIVESEIHRRFFSPLGNRKKIMHEKKVHGYKCDLFIEDTSTIVEVKSIISLDKEAIFPSVYSQRAVNQLNKLTELLQQGYKVAYVFVSLNPYVTNLSINQKEPFFSLFNQCLDEGMQVYGFDVKICGDAIQIKSSIPVVANLSE